MVYVYILISDKNVGMFYQAVWGKRKLLAYCH